MSNKKVEKVEKVKRTLPESIRKLEQNSAEIEAVKAAATKGGRLSRGTSLNM